MIKQRCRKLRARGFSIGEIAHRIHVSESTVHWHVKDINLTSIQVERIRQRKRILMQRINAKRRGKPVLPVVFCRPRWSLALVHLIAHLTFDGRIDRYSCHYYSRSHSEALHVKFALQRLLHVTPTMRLKVNGIWIVSYYNVEVAAWLLNKEQELLQKVSRHGIWQVVWLKALFDDEGHVHISKGIRRVRASQDNPVVLNRARKFLKAIGIRSRIDHRARAIEIAGRNNLFLFQQHINFSPGLTINARRKNGLWSDPFKKRQLLRRALRTYAL